jgi:hypothetical protein
MRQVLVSFSMTERIIYFSKGAMEEFVLKAGMRLTFVVDVGRLYFYISDKEKEGFFLSLTRHLSGQVASKLLVKTLYEKLPQIKRNGPRFGLRVSNIRINDCATFEILIDKKYSHE